MSQEERKKELEKLTIDQLVKLAKDEHNVILDVPKKPTKPEAIEILLELEQGKRDQDLTNINQALIAENTALKAENEQLKADKFELESTNKNLSEQLVTAAEFIDERDDTINVFEEENKQLKADKAELKGKNKALNDELITTAAFSDVLEKENRILKANQPTKTDAESLETKEDNNLGTGDNVVNVSTVIGLDSRMRAGFTFTRKTATYYLSDDELSAIKADKHLIIHGEVTKREVE